MNLGADQLFLGEVSGGFDVQPDETDLYNYAGPADTADQNRFAGCLVFSHPYPSVTVAYQNLIEAVSKEPFRSIELDEQNNVLTIEYKTNPFSYEKETKYSRSNFQDTYASKEDGLYYEKKIKAGQMSRQGVIRAIRSGREETISQRSAPKPAINPSIKKPDNSTSFKARKPTPTIPAPKKKLKISNSHAVCVNETRNNPSKTLKAYVDDKVISMSKAVKYVSKGQNFKCALFNKTGSAYVKYAIYSKGAKMGASETYILPENKSIYAHAEGGGIVVKSIAIDYLALEPES